MWFLEHDILFGGKRVWLRPGSQQLFGRTKNSDADGTGGKHVFIDNKNVSRKHMMIKVLEVPTGDGTKLHARSQIEVTDLSCRQGTVLDGQNTLKSSKQADGSIAYDKTVLTGTEHTIKLTSSYPPFTIKWQDVVFTFATKEKKSSTQASNNRNAQLHAIDIKTSTEFVHGKTTHVVSGKRNLPKVLQGLTAGAFIVTPDYLDALLNAADSMDSDIPSKLEEDFDIWWPQEKEYIPAVGAEPVPRPDQMLLPDSTRSEIFSGLSFVFLDEGQYASLHQVVASAGGKALSYDVQPGETTVEEYVDYVKSVAGHKKRSKTDARDLPVITIRLPSYPEGHETWAEDFTGGVVLALNQRSIMQNEFLDAIVMKDASALRRPPDPEMSQLASSLPAAAPTQRSARSRGATPAVESRAPSQPPEVASASAEEPPKPASRKRAVRRGVTSRFTGFDDYVPPSQVKKTQEDVPMEDVQEYTPQEEPPPQSPPVTQSQRATRSQPQQSIEASAQLDQILPAAAKIKRKRAATRASSASIEPENQASIATAPVDKQPTKTQRIEQLQRERTAKLKKLENDLNIQEESRRKLAEAEEARRDNEEKMKEELDGVDISKLHVDVQIASMPLRQREPQGNHREQNHANAGATDRWNPDWTGRKNFKLFRRRGDDRQRVPAAQRVIVSFQEAPPRKGFGDTFLIEESTAPSREEVERSFLKRRQARQPDSESEPEAGFRRKRPRAAAAVSAAPAGRGRGRAASTSAGAEEDREIINVEDSGPDEEDEAPIATGSTIRNSGRTQRVEETQVEETQRKGPRKRPSAGGPAGGQPVAKRGRMAVARRAVDSDDEEETGFRFRKRG